MTNRPGDARFYKLLDEMADIHAKKSADYSPGADSLQNFRAAVDLGARPYIGLLLRLSDKWQRVKTYAKGGALQNESIRDAHLDSAVYHLLALLLLEDEQPKPLFTGSTATYSPINPDTAEVLAALQETRKEYYAEDSDPDRACKIGHA